MVRGETLSEIARTLNSERFTALLLKNEIRVKQDSNLEDALESLTGAIIRQ